MDGIEQEEFLALLKQRNNLAYKRLYSLYFVALRNLANRYVNDLDIASDLVQDTFFSLLESDKIFTSTDQVKYFLFTALKNKCISHLRKITVRTNAQDHIIYDINTLNNFWDNALEEDVYSRLMLAIDTLPPQCKLVIQFTLEGLKTVEIAQRMNISPETVKDHKANGRKKLKEWFKDSDMLFLLYFLLI